MIDEAELYLNSFIAPHQLLGLSIFEEDHPCTNNVFNLVIMHKGDDTVPLKRPADL